MSAPTAVLSYGATALFLGETPRIVRRSDGFDEGQFEFHLGTENSLQPGAQVPGYSGLYITEDSITDHSGDLEHSVRAVGLRSGDRRKIATSATSSEDGFDTGSETWIERVNRFQYGMSHSLFHGLYLVGITEKNSPVNAYKIYDLQFKGIKDFSRPIRYKYATTVRESVLENFRNGFPGGDGNNPRRWSILMGEPSLEKSFLSNSPPDYRRVGSQGSTDPKLPVGFEPGFAPSEDALTWQWPNGGVLVDINAEEVPGRNCYFITETYVRRPRIIA